MLTLIVALLAGLLIGSFLNVCIYRLPRDLSVVRPHRSFCPGCEKPIAWYDNIPALSFALLRGKCRSCGKAISWRYPVVELSTGGIFAFIAVTHAGALPVTFKLCTLSALLVGLVFSDLEERILPDEFTLGGLVLALVFAAVAPGRIGLIGFFLPRDWNPRLSSVVESAISAALAGGLFWAIRQGYSAVRKREGMGLGDVKMAAMLGAFLGFEWTLMTVMVGSALGLVASLIFIVVKRKDASTYELPFGSFIGLAALAVALGLLGRPVWG